jgi:iron complex outermembrane receptor protein
MRFYRKILLSTASLGMLAAGAAAAQTSPPAKSDEIVEEIVVTALKRSTTLQTTPMSISAVTGDTLDKLGATGLSDYFRQVPGVNLAQGQLGQSRVTIRGVAGSGEATTGLYYDETPVTGPSGTTQDPANNAADLNLFDVERVEVLRGPQGTLYGGSSMGGTLKVIYNKPRRRRIWRIGRSQASTTKGGSSGFVPEGHGQYPADPRQAGRPDRGLHRRPRRLHRQRQVQDQERQRQPQQTAIASMLGFTPTDDITVIGTVLHQSSSADDLQGYYQRLGKDKTDVSVVLPFESEMDLTSLNAKWNTDLGELTAVTSYYKYSILRTIDFTPQYQALCGQRVRGDGLSAGAAAILEPRGPLQLQGHGAVPVDGRPLRRAAQGPHRQSDGAGRPGHRQGLFDPLRFIFARAVDTEIKQTSQFGELNYSPEQVSGLTLTVGARHYDYTKTTSGYGVKPNLLTGAPNAPYAEQKANAKGWVYKFNASYKVNSDVLVYGTASEGFRPGRRQQRPGPERGPGRL